MLGWTTKPRASNHDIVLVMKTGATEALEKLPIHFNTTFASWPKVLVYSDYTEDIQGFTIHDALADITPSIRLSHPDFDLWRRLNTYGRSTLRHSELSSSQVKDEESAYGKTDNAGWRLARFMNLPMVVRALADSPNANWYVFIDADTYLSYSNVQKWTAELDHTKPIYLGSETVLYGGIFAHGGSGYILSRSAARRVAQLYTENQREWDELASQPQGGDYTLAMALERIEIPLILSRPLLQGTEPYSLHFAQDVRGRRLWCYPAVSYHHVPADTIQELWNVEQRWTRNQTTALRPLTHGDVLQSLLSGAERADWDNGSEDLVDGSNSDKQWSSQPCREACKANSTCLQYSFSDQGCRNSVKVVLGAHKDGTTSGWMTDRISEQLSASRLCDGSLWPLP